MGDDSIVDRERMIVIFCFSLKTLQSSIEKEVSKIKEHIAYVKEHSEKELRNAKTHIRRSTSKKMA